MPIIGAFSTRGLTGIGLSAGSAEPVLGSAYSTTFTNWPLGSVGYDASGDVYIVSSPHSTVAPFYVEISAVRINADKSFTRGPAYIVNSSDSRNLDMAFDASVNKSLIVWRDTGASENIGAVVCTASSSSLTLSFGALQTVTTNTNLANPHVVYDEAAQKCLCVYEEDDAPAPILARVVTVNSDSTISGGAETTVFSAISGQTVRAIGYDSTAQKCWLAHRNDTEIAVTVLSVSGTTVTAGSTTNVHSYISDGYNFPSSATHHPTTGYNVMISERQDNDLVRWWTHVTTFKITGTSVTNVTGTQIIDSQGACSQQGSTSYDPTIDRVVFAGPRYYRAGVGTDIIHLPPRIRHLEILSNGVVNQDFTIDTTAWSGSDAVNRPAFISQSSQNATIDNSGNHFFLYQINDKSAIYGQVWFPGS